MADAGVAGLYSLRMGQPDASPPFSAHWLSKPSGMSYPTFFESLRPLCQEGATLWGRQMVLGPTPEFCLHARQRLALPYPSTQLALTPVFDQTL